MSIGWHRCFDGLSIVHVKLLEHIVGVLGLTYECTILELLDLKTEKELQLAHHRHLKSFGHDPTKLINPNLISRSKYDIINIYLTYKQIIALFTSEESRIDFAYFKAFLNEKFLKAFIPCSRGLLEPIERLMELVDVVWKLWIFKA
jgi:hypothetical protein